MPQLFSNNSQSYVVAATTPQATIIVVADGDKFPELAINNDDFFLLTLVGVGTSGKEETWEIVKVTAKNNDTLTIVRGQEDTVAQSWPEVTPVECRFTAGSAAIVSADGIDGIDGAQGNEGPQGPIGEASEIFYSALPPADQAENPLWFNTETGRNYVWYEDINSGQWIQTTAEVEPSEIVVTSTTVTTVDVLTTPLGREAEEDLVNQQDVNWYLWDEIETKLGSAGGTMTGALTVKGANLLMQGSAGTTNMTLGASGDISAKVINANSKMQIHSSIEMNDTKITGLAAPSEDDHATTKGAVADAFQARNLKDNDIPETIRSGSSANLSIMEWHGYDGTAEGNRARKAWVAANGRIHSGYDISKGLVDTDLVTKKYVDDEAVSLTNTSQQEIKGNLKVKGYGYLDFNGDATSSLLNKSKIESLIGDAIDEIPASGGGGSSVLGRAFEYDGVEDSWFRIDAQKFGIFDASSQLTSSLSAAKFLVVHQDDKEGFVFHTQGLNISTMHAGTISLLTTAGRYLGAWSLDEWGTNGFIGSSSAGKYVTSIALGEWKGAGSAAITTGTTYRLSSTLWGK